MLCDLALRLTEEGSYRLRIIEKTALGPSGTVGRDSKDYPIVDALSSDLEFLGLGPEVIAVAFRTLDRPETRSRFITFAEDMQIPSEMLERAGIYLFY